MRKCRLYILDAIDITSLSTHLGHNTIFGSNSNIYDLIPSRKRMYFVNNLLSNVKNSSPITYRSNSRFQNVHRLFIR